MINDNYIKFRLLSEEAKLPIRKHVTDAGLDLSATGYYFIPPGEMKPVSTGLAVAIDRGYVGLVFSRSGMGKIKVTLSNSVGVIDADYRGELIVMVQNNGIEPFVINIHDRIAQLVILPVYTPIPIAYNGTEEDWLDTCRGDKGFGSTGTK